MEIRQGEQRLQELFMERVHLKERSTTLQAKVKNMEDKIKRDFLDPKPIGLKKENACVGTLGKEDDHTKRIGALRLEGINIPLELAQTLVVNTIPQVSLALQYY